MENFNNILNNEWDHLIAATKTAKHPFHQFILSNSIENQPASRMVILRNADKDNRLISFNTDKRSPKYSSLLKHNIVAVLFYDSKRKIQLRINGIIKKNNNKVSKLLWDKMALESKMCYMGKFAPSSIINEYEPNIPLKKITEISEEEYNLGFINFINFQIKINSIDWLYLHSSGHKRIMYKWNNNELITNWLAT